MRNGSCVPGHSIRAAFHQSRGRGAPAATLCFSICVSSRTNNRQAAYGLAHTIAFTHGPSCGRAGVHVHKHTGPVTDHMYTHTHTQSHYSTVNNERHILHVLRWVTFITFLSLSLFGLFWTHSSIEHNESNHYTHVSNAIPYKQSEFSLNYSLLCYNMCDK